MGPVDLAHRPKQVRIAPHPMGVGLVEGDGKRLLILVEIGPPAGNRGEHSPEHLLLARGAVAVEPDQAHAGRELHLVVVHLRQGGPRPVEVVDELLDEGASSGANSSNTLIWLC